MGIAVIGLIFVAVLALLAIPVIAAIVGRSTTDEDPNETGDPARDPNVEAKRESSKEGGQEEARSAREKG